MISPVSISTALAVLSTREMGCLVKRTRSALWCVRPWERTASALKTSTSLCGLVVSLRPLPLCLHWYAQLRTD